MCVIIWACVKFCNLSVTLLLVGHIQGIDLRWPMLYGGGRHEDWLQLQLNCKHHFNASSADLVFVLFLFLNDTAPRNSTSFIAGFLVYWTPQESNCKSELRKPGVLFLFIQVNTTIHEISPGVFKILTLSDHRPNIVKIQLRVHNQPLKVKSK